MDNKRLETGYTTSSCESMDSAPEEINFREQIIEIVQFLADIYHRLREGTEEDNFFLRWCPACLRRDSRHKSVVRWLGNRMPCVFVDFCRIYNYKTLLDAVFTERSLVREIGSRLPLQPSKRPYFYMLQKPATETHSTKVDGGTRFVHSTPCRNGISPSSTILWEDMNDSCQENTFNQSSATVPGDTVRKITALEDELNRLRAQIAGFVLNQEEPTATEIECLTATNQQALIPPPPPPPPLPTTSSISVPRQTTKKLTCKADITKDNSVLDMTAILKDLNQVKLKAVKRSPGGTPIRRAPRQTKRTDPASIIADALKNKFAKSRMTVTSPDKENLSSNSPGNSFANTPSPQPHFRKPQSERKAMMTSQAKTSPAVNNRLEFKTHVTPIRG